MKAESTETIYARILNNTITEEQYQRWLNGKLKAYAKELIEKERKELMSNADNAKTYEESLIFAVKIKALEQLLKKINQ